MDKVYPNYGLNFEPAQSDSEYEELVKKKPEGMITSKDEFRNFFDKNTHLMAEEYLAEFEESLVFDNGSLAGFHYGKIIETMPARKFEELLANFGIGYKFFCDRRKQLCRISPGSPKRCEGTLKDTDYCWYCPCPGE